MRAITLAVLAASMGCSTGKTTAKSFVTPAEPKPLWTLSDPGILNPESAYFDPESKVLFVSNVAGEALKKDGIGWISQVDPVTGKMLKAKWVQGLNAPKGIRVVKGMLWVSDIDHLVGIDIKAGKIVRNIHIKGAKFLNDTAVGPNGEIFVSDMLTGNIYQLNGKKISVFVKVPEGELPNGLLIMGNSLVMAGWGTGMNADFTTKLLGHLISFDLKTKRGTLITPVGFGNLDGLETDGNGNFLVSDWIAGKIYLVSNGRPELLMQKTQGTADIGYIPESKTLIVPNMKESTISAYRLF